MKLKKIKVYGKLRKDLGCSYFEAVVNSPLDAFRFLNANYPNLEKYMSEQYYKIKMNGIDLETEEDLKLTGEGVIQIIPYATGSLPAVLGIGALVGGAAVTKATVAGVGFLGATLIGKVTVGAAIGGALTAVGTGLVLQGVTSMISPTPQVTYPTSSISTGVNRNDATLEDSNYSFSNITNVSRAGVTLPLVYGEMFVGSVLIGNGIDTDQVGNPRAITSN